MTKRVKLTPDMLKKIVQEEVSKLGNEVEPVEDRAKETEETDADEQADSLEKHIDYVKALKIEEARLNKRLAKVRESKERALKSLVKKI